MTRAAHTPDSAFLVRWAFFRGTRALTCEVRTTDRGAFDVCVVPLWDVNAAVIEPYDTAGAALRRHAQIAAAFRQGGWVVARETPRRGTEVAA